MNVENIITLKELFERLITIETKFDVLTGENLKTKKLFQIYVVLMVGLMLTNIALVSFALYFAKL